MQRESASLPKHQSPQPKIKTLRPKTHSQNHTRALPVTRRTAGNVGYRAQLVLLHQVRAQRNLIDIFLAIKLDWLAARRLLVTHIEYLVTRTQILLRGSM